MHCCVISLTLRCRFAPPFPKPLPPFPLPDISISLSDSLVFLWGLIGRRPSCPKKKKSRHLANFRPSIGPTGLKALNLSHTISLYCHSRSLLSPPSSASNRSSSSPFSPVSLSFSLLGHHRLSLETTTVLSILFMEEL